MSDTAPPPWLAKAEAYIGFHESGNNQGIEHFIALAHTGSLGDPWCAIFANACLEEAGIRGSRSPAARSFEHDDNFVQLAGPALGAITTNWRDSPSSGLGHVYFYCGENGNGIVGLGGNQSDQVCRQYEPHERVQGYWWPKSVALPVTGVITLAEATALTGPLASDVVEKIEATAPADAAGDWSSGRGSWYSQNPPDWHDSGDKPESNALQVLDACQGISFFDHTTLGDWFEVEAPNGVRSIEQQTDLGPNPRTGRTIDISAAAAPRFGYTPHSFPTDSTFRWRPIASPASVASLSPAKQASAYAALRGTPAAAPASRPKDPTQMSDTLAIIPAAPSQTQKPGVDREAMAEFVKALREEEAKNPAVKQSWGTLLQIGISAATTAFPQFAVAGYLVQFLLSQAGFMGAAMGADATPIGQSAGATFLAMIASWGASKINQLIGKPPSSAAG